MRTRDPLIARSCALACRSQDRSTMSAYSRSNPDIGQLVDAFWKGLDVHFSHPGSHFPPRGLRYPTISLFGYQMRPLIGGN